MTEYLDHRSRVAAERRLRMRARLIESAILVFAEKGAAASVIQEVVAAAGVAQGTFYNYFRTNEELLAAVIETLNNEIMTIIETVVGTIENPANRLATGLRLYLHSAQNYPVLARFIDSVKLEFIDSNSSLHSLLPPDIQEGIDKLFFAETKMDVALDLIAGTMFAAVKHIVNGAEQKYPEYIVEVILRGLGVPPVEARTIVANPLIPLEIPNDSLLMRAHLRFAS